ncbi:AAA family ATPase [Skermania sp. ID1734]|uniref:AAA family ATPase n=1 Tax=Skermania sp. ID1734 TaxID=2597516 RepID=UPI00163DB19B|nr:AAA family ATPase [Skermania sp. ID1734]
MIEYGTDYSTIEDAAINGADPYADVPLPTLPDDSTAARFEAEVDRHLLAKRARAEADKRWSEEQRQAVELPAFARLDRFLDEPDELVRYRVDQLQAVDARVIVAAQYKSGKTTVIGNLIRCLVDGDPFLGKFPVETVGRVALLDDELSPRDLRRWLRDQGVVNAGRVHVCSLRGKVSAFDILNAETRAQWAAALTGTNYLILDCLRPVLDALGLDERRDAGRFLVAFDELLNDAGIGEAAVVHHMGHGGERSRGDSRLLDWPDANWKLVREDPDREGSPRYFSAFGRDVSVAEGRLEYEQSSRRLTYASGNRTDQAAEDALVDVVKTLIGTEPMSGRQVEESLTDTPHPRKAVRSGLKLAIGRGLVAVDTGPRGAKLHRIASPCRVCGGPLIGTEGAHLECRGGGE